MSGPDDLERLARRLERLESHAAFQEEVIHKLDEVVRTFAARVEQVETTLTALASTLTPPGTAPETPEEEQRVPTSG